jgi:4'-phosphopantetheinyl transferase
LPDVDTRVEVWLVHTDQPAPVVSELESVLDDDERARANTFGWPAERRRYVVAHGAARCILAAHLGVRADDIRWRRGRRGKPELVGGGPHVNLSHSGELAALAICDDRPVGIDVQELSPGLRPGRMAERYFHADEAAHVAGSVERFARLWVRKEACVKAAGGTLWPALSLPVLHDIVVPGPFRVTDIPVPAGFRAAVALTGDRPYRTMLRTWTGVTLPPVDTDIVVTELATMLTGVIGEQPPITASTRLEQDLRLESIEVAVLGERMRERWGEGVDLAAFYAELDIDQIIALTVGDLADYVTSRIDE